MPRFHLPASEWKSTIPTLSASESHHALDVLRLRGDDKVEVFDGEGRAASARICIPEKTAVGLEILEIRPATPRRCSLTLAQAIPKGKNMDFIIQKAVELGAAGIVPLLTKHTVVRLKRTEAEKKQSKWQEIAIEACKQCGQNWLPHIAVPGSLAQFLSGPDRPELLLIASLQPGAAKIGKCLAAHSPSASVGILIGPEGDFSPDETTLALEQGCHPVTLGPIVLRTETAAIASLGVLAHELII